jgi:hypothetical protein
MSLDADDLHHFDFDDPLAAWLALPLSILLSAVVRALGPPDMLFWYFFSIPTHEMGHAIAAWLSGRLAIPVGAFIPMAGMTFYFSFDRHVWMYLLVLAGLLALLYRGWHSGSSFLGGLAAVLVVLQFKMTWLTTAEQAQMAFTIGGIRGEFLLGTTLILGYFYRLPIPRWDFFRYLPLVAGTYVLSSAFWLWRHIASGKKEMPLGSFLNGSGDSNGDLDKLMQQHDWTAQGLIHHFNQLGVLCVTVVVAHYLWFGLRASRR